MIDITEIVVAVIGLIATIITTVLVPYLKKKINIENYEIIKTWAKIGVQAAEMIYTESGMGAEKKEYVKNFLNEKGLDIDEETISVLIESAVLEMKNAIE